MAPSWKQSLGGGSDELFLWDQRWTISCYFAFLASLPRCGVGGCGRGCGQGPSNWEVLYRRGHACFCLIPRKGSIRYESGWKALMCWGLYGKKETGKLGLMAVTQSLSCCLLPEYWGKKGLELIGQSSATVSPLCTMSLLWLPLPLSLVSVQWRD